MTIWLKLSKMCKMKLSRHLNYNSKSLLQKSTIPRQSGNLAKKQFVEKFGLLRLGE